MIFSNQALHKAFAYKSAYYNKVLLVNLNDGSFEPIKVDDEEWTKLDKITSYDKWVRDFSKSALYDGLYLDREKFYHFAGINALRRTKNPDYIKYQKLIGNEWHVVLLEILPIDDDHTYIFVKDLDKLLKGEREEYGIRE